jgi:enoyl-CoA hydratase
MWACDLIVAAEDTQFADVVATRLGMMGVEYFAHPWEFGPRKAKELLLTGDALGVDEAYAMGMVSKVFPQDQLSEKTLDFARRIATLPTQAALLVKEAVNQSQDNMGFTNALNACFTIHELNHSHWAIKSGGQRWVAVSDFDEGVQDWRTAPPVLNAKKTEVGG